MISIQRFFPNVGVDWFKSSTVGSFSLFCTWITHGKHTKVFSAAHIVDLLTNSLKRQTLSIKEEKEGDWLKFFPSYKNRQNYMRRINQFLCDNEVWISNFSCLICFRIVSICWLVSCNFACSSWTKRLKNHKNINFKHPQKNSTCMA